MHPVRVIGHGVDIVSIERIGKMVADHGDRFLERCFTPAEISYAGDRARRDERLAARFAAKEAALKAIGTGWRSGISWTDVEVLRLPSGEPSLRISGKVAEIAASMGVDVWLVSLSHAGDYALASVIAGAKLSPAP